MAYPYGEAANSIGQTSPGELPALLRDIDNLNGSLREIFGRLQKIGDTLHGPLPRDASADKNPRPPEANSVRRTLDACQRAAGEIHDELTRIERNL